MNCFQLYTDQVRVLSSLTSGASDFSLLSYKKLTSNLVYELVLAKYSSFKFYCAWPNFPLLKFSFSNKLFYVVFWYVDLNFCIWICLHVSKICQLLCSTYPLLKFSFPNFSVLSKKIMNFKLLDEFVWTKLRSSSTFKLFWLLLLGAMPLDLFVLVVDLYCFFNNTVRMLVYFDKMLILLCPKITQIVPLKWRRSVTFCVQPHFAWSGNSSSTVYTRCYINWCKVPEIAQWLHMLYMLYGEYCANVWIRKLYGSYENIQIRV